MKDLKKKFSLKKYNSFGLDVDAAWFCKATSQESLYTILQQPEIRELPRLILGEGSNILFMNGYEGLVIHPAMKGIRLLEEQGDEVLVQVGAAENWDDWVNHATEQGWYGLENLSLIPGTVGAAPVQNIGAYGVELRDRFAWLEAWDLQEQKAVRLDQEECRFGYRSSVFKEEGRMRYLITQVCFRLSRIPRLVLDYGAVRSAFTEAGGSTPADLRHLIIHIRNSKLPDPASFGNCGSFFKNPVIGRAIYNCIRVEHPDVPGYPDEENKVKIPAAWLIEQAGWKNKRLGAVGTWPTQPLVIVNYGGASGSEIYDFSALIQEAVEEKFSISLEREVQLH